MSSYVAIPVGFSLACLEGTSVFIFPDIIDGKTKTRGERRWFTFNWRCVLKKLKLIDSILPRSEQFQVNSISEMM